MQNRRTYHLVVTVVCFVFAGMNAYRIWQGAYTGFDVFLLVMFLLMGGTYLYMLRRSDKKS